MGINGEYEMEETHNQPVLDFFPASENDPLGPLTDVGRDLRVLGFPQELCNVVAGYAATYTSLAHLGFNPKNQNLTIEALRRLFIQPHGRAIIHGMPGQHGETFVIAKGIGNYETAVLEDPVRAYRGFYSEEHRSKIHPRLWGAGTIEELSKEYINGLVVFDILSQGGKNVTDITQGWIVPLGVFDQPGLTEAVVQTLSEQDMPRHKTVRLGTAIMLVPAQERVWDFTPEDRARAEAKMEQVEMAVKLAENTRALLSHGIILHQTSMHLQNVYACPDAHMVLGDMGDMDFIDDLIPENMDDGEKMPKIHYINCTIPKITNFDLRVYILARALGANDFFPGNTAAQQHAKNAFYRTLLGRNLTDDEEVLMGMNPSARRASTKYRGVLINMSKELIEEVYDAERWGTARKKRDVLGQIYGLPEEVVDEKTLIGTLQWLWYHDKCS